MDLRYFGLLPFFFLIFFFSQGFNDFKLQVPDQVLGEKYGLYLLSLLIFFGLFGILNFVGMESWSAFWLLLFLSGIGRITSYLIPYPDGKYLFRYGIFLIGGLLLCNHLLNEGGEGFLTLGGAILFSWVLFFGIITYGISQLAHVETAEEKYFFFLLLLLGEYAILSWINPIFYGFGGGLLLWSGALLGLLRIQQLPNTAPWEQKPISVRRILAGERILKKEKADSFAQLQAFFLGFKELPTLFRSGLEYINVALLIWVLVSYLRGMLNALQLSARGYWLGVAIFLLNSFLLKKLSIFSLISRFAAALIINFSLTISLISLGENMLEMLPRLICWNIACSILLLNTNQPAIKPYLHKSDLIFWLISNMVAMLLNLVLILQLPESGQLIFSMIFFYVGLQGTLSYYALPIIIRFEESKKEKGKSDTLDHLLEKEMKGIF